MVCDDSIATVGSTNVDFRSFENNFEANMFVYDEQLARRVRAIFLDDEQHAVSITRQKNLMHPGFFARLGESLARLLSPLL